MNRPLNRTSRRSWLASIAAAVCLASVSVPLAALAPEPDPVPRRWELQVDAGMLRMATIDVPRLGVRKYFYMTFRATNNSGQDLLFAPSFELSDGDGNLARSGRDVPQLVTQTLMQEAQNPYLQDQIGVIGTLSQGSENAKDTIVIWPADGLNPTQLTVYAAGFSGETKTVTSPDGKEKFILRKTMRLDFRPSGDLSGVGVESFPLAEKSWIMR